MSAADVLDALVFNKLLFFKTFSLTKSSDKNEKDP
jgi:hypothetical protein